MAGSNFGNRVVGWLLQSPMHAMLDGSILLVSVTGRNSGKQIVTPVNYTREGEIFWVTSQRSRQWWRNCRKYKVLRVLFKGQWVNGGVEVLDDLKKVASAFEHLFELAPGLAKLYGVVKTSGGVFELSKLSSLAERSVILKIQLLSE